MKTTALDTKEVQVTITLYVLTEKVFELDECPDWAQYAAVDENWTAYWYSSRPFRMSYKWFYRPDCKRKTIGKCNFDAADWQNSLIKRPEKVLEVTLAELEKKYGCKVKIVK